MIPSVVINSQVPIYEQIYNGIASDIVKGVLAPGEMLPSIRYVAVEMKISVISIKKAWEMLENDGLITTTIGKGSFVSALAEEKLEQIKMKLISARIEKNLDFYRQIHAKPQEIMEILTKLL